MAYNSVYTGQQIDTAVRDGEWYNLQCVSDGSMSSPGQPSFRFTRFIVIENFVPKLLGEEYRLVFMRERRTAGKGLKWNIPMFGSIRGSVGCSPLEETFVPIDSNAVAVDFGFVTWSRENFPNRHNKLCARFIDTMNTRKRVGYAIFKHTGIGTFGWQRVSNIAGICASQGNKPQDRFPNYSAISI